MQLLYRGKTKDVYEAGPETLLLQFTDRVTKNDAGEIDPGGNTVAEDTAPGQGGACLAVTSVLFETLQKQGVANTHMVDYDLEKLTMTVKKGKLFTPGLEWVARWVCTGSFLRRYNMIAGTYDGMPLPSPVFEVTLKNDAAGDPPIVPSALVALGIVPAATMEKLLPLNERTLQAIRGMFAERGLDLWDIKIEWGLDAAGEPLLIDEVSPGCCRAYKAGTKERVVGLELAAYFKK